MRILSSIRPLAVGALAVILVLAIAPAEAQRRGGRGPSGISRSGPAGSGSVRTSRSVGERSQRRDVDRRDDRREFREDVRDDRRDRYEDRWRVGRALSRSSYRSLTCRTTIIVTSGITYYSCGGGWYRRAYQGGAVVYVVVSAPAGY